MMTARHACHDHSPPARTRTMIAIARRAADLLLPLITPPKGSGEHAAGGSADRHPPVPATAPGRSRQRQAAPAGS